MKVVIIQTAFIGDVILCSSLVESLCKKGHTVGFVAKPEAATIFDSDPRINKVHVFDKRNKDRGFSGLLQLANSIKSEKYDAAVIPHRSLRSAALAWLSRIPLRIGFMESTGKLLFNVKVSYDNLEHEIVRNHKLINSLAIDGAPLPPKIFISEKARKSAESFLFNEGLGTDNYFVGIGPGSKWFTKQWSVEKFSSLAGLIIEKIGCKVICFGGMEDTGLVEEISRLNPDQIINTAGKFSLQESAGILEKAALAVTNDNGFMHLAVAVGIPVVAIFGPTVPEFGFAPWGTEHTVVQRELYCRPCSIHGSNKCPEKHFKCMNEIDPEEVLEIVKTRVKLLYPTNHLS